MKRKKARESKEERGVAVTPERKRALLTLHEFCDELNLSYDYGRKAAQRREFTIVRLKRRVFVPIGEVQKFIEQRMVPAKEAR